MTEQVILVGTNDVDPVTDATTAIKVNPANGALLVEGLVSTGGSLSTEYTEDVASIANPVGGQLMGRRRDTLSVETTTDGDVTALNCTSKGETYVKHVDSIAITAASLPLIHILV